MELKLVNFRSFQEKTVILPVKGITLISGEISAGKSTILTAIEWVLYGKVKKVETHRLAKSKKTSVTLIYTGYCINRYPKKSKSKITKIEIYRQKNSKLLTVTCNEHKHVDEDAQQIINEIFGPADLFGVTSYLRQLHICDIITSSNLEQMHNLEQLAFKEQDIAGFKQMIADRIKKVKASTGKSATLHEAAIEELERFDKLNPHIKVKGSEEKDLTLEQDIDGKIKELEAEVKKLTTEEKEQYAEETIRKRIIKEEEKKKQELQSIEEGLEEYEIAPSDIEETLTTVTADISKLNNAIATLTADLETAKLAGEYETLMKGGEKEDYKAKLKEKLETLTQSGSPGTDTKITSKNVDSLISDGERIINNRALLQKQYEILSISNLSEAETMVDELKLQWKKQKEREEELKKIHYNCPECKANLSLIDGKLTKVEGTVIIENKDDEYAKIKEENKALKVRIAKIEAVISAVEGIDIEPKNFIFTKDSTVDDIKNGIEILRDVKILMVKEQQQQKTLQRESKLRDLLQGKDVGTVSQIKTNINNKKKEIAQKEEQQQVLSALAVRYKQYLKASKEVKTVKDPKECKDRILEIQKELEKVNADLNRYKFARANNLLQVQRQEINTRIAKLRKTREEYEKELSTLYLLKETSIKAENISLDKTVDAINTELATQLEILFKDPIEVRIETTKTLKNKNTKDAFNIVIMYKGNEYSSIHELSGGEKAKTSLALTIALNKYSNSPILMLDETLSSLDPDSYDNVIEALKSYASHTPVFVVQHQGAKGMFDSEIRM